MQMQEYLRVRQDKGGFKRYFTDDQFDLFVWYTKRNGTVTGCQLVYDKWTGPKAFTWIKDKGYRHNRIDGYDSNRWNLTPFLVADGYFDKEEIAHRFLEHSKGIEKEIVELVFRSIMDYDQNRDDQSI